MKSIKKLKPVVILSLENSYYQNNNTSALEKLFEQYLKECMVNFFISMTLLLKITMAQERNMELTKHLHLSQLLYNALCSILAFWNCCHSLPQSVEYEIMNRL